MKLLRSLLPLAAGGLLGCLSPLVHPPAEPRALEPRGGSFETDLRRAAEAGTWPRLRLEAECRIGEQWKSAIVYGNGVGIWAAERQFELGRKEVQALLQRIVASGFLGWREAHGAPPQADEDIELGLRLSCRVAVALGEQSRQSFQLDRGEPFEPLRRLAEGLLDELEERGSAGRAAASLEHGLRSIADGELAPECLVLRFAADPERPRPDAVGWSLRVRGGEMLVERHSEAAGYEPVRRLESSGARLRRLARRLADADLPTLPANLWSEQIEELEVGVLAHRRSLQARGYSEVDPAAQAEARERWRALVRELRALAAGP